MKNPLSLLKRITALAALATLTACGGGGGGGGDTPPAPATAKLSGTVQTGSLPAASGKLSKALLTGITTGISSSTGATVDESNFTTGTNLANAIVIAVDDTGESHTTTSDKQGLFSIDLATGKRYAIIFLDTRTMKVVGSLVQAADTSISGSLTPTADIDLGHVVVDPLQSAAVAESDVYNEVVVDNAEDMDKDGDGIITTDDVTYIQAETLTSSSTALTNISLVNFLGDADTWHTGFDFYDYGSGDGWQERTFVLNRETAVTGPNGNMVTAMKKGEIEYFDIYYFDITDPTTGSGGYYDPSLLWYDAATLTTPPTSFDYVYGWADYTYVDAANEKVLWGYRDWISGNVMWDGFSLPLEFKPGESLTSGNSDEFPDCWDPADPTTCYTYTTSFSETVTIDVAKNSDGSAAIVTDAQDRNLPVVKVTSTASYSYIEKDYTGTITFEDSGSYNDGFYLVAKFGAEAPSSDATGNLTWDQALAKYARFGTIDLNNTIVDATPANIGAYSINQVMPNIDDSSITAATRNSWLTFLSDSIDILDAYDSSTGSASGDYMWIDWPADGSSPVTPASWDPVTYSVYTFIEGTLTEVDGKTSATNITVDGIHFMTSDLANTTVTLHFRAWDPVSGNSVDVVTPYDVTANVTVADAACFDPLNGIECVGTITAPSTIMFPTLTDIENVAGADSSYDFWVSNGTTYDIYKENSVELWIKVSNTNGSMEEYLDWYYIRDDAPSQTNQKLR